MLVQNAKFSRNDFFLFGGNSRKNKPVGTVRCQGNFGSLIRIPLSRLYSTVYSVESGLYGGMVTLVL